MTEAETKTWSRRGADRLDHNGICGTDLHIFRLLVRLPDSLWLGR